jgi:hypothetical protein
LVFKNLRQLATKCGRALGADSESYVLVSSIRDREAHWQTTSTKRELAGTADTALASARAPAALRLRPTPRTRT